jgi:redox-sensitive bicupin YhaK (pirin superfamily)
MSWIPTNDPECPSKDLDLIETLIIPRARDIGGFEVRRALPAGERQMVGPFIFFDQMGPAEFITGAGGIDVRPHPHIGLATITYLFKGEFQHRDSIGSNQMIYPGEVNWMVAGKGVTHSERTSEETRKNPHSVFGIQTWVALPEAHEDVNPIFEHHAKDHLPVIEFQGANARLVIGNAYGERAPVKTFSEMFYLDVFLEPNASIPLPDNHEDRGIYIIDGQISVSGKTYETGQMLVFKPGDPISVKALESGARLMLLGGETLNGPRHIWWNFVSSSKEKLEAAKAAWKQADFENGPFKLPPGDDEEFIPI